MAVWRIEEDCLAPYPQIIISYKGPNPFLVYKGARDIIRGILEIGAADYWERDFRWDISGEPRSFFVRIYAKKGMDARTYAMFEVIFQGNQPTDPKKEGDVTIKIGARLITEYPQETPFQKTPFYRNLVKIYRFLWYERVRKGYLKLCQDFAYRLEEKFRELLKIPKR